MAYATPRSMNARKKRSVCRQSTADNRTVCNSHVPYVIFSSIGGTMRDTQKLSIQLAEAARAVPGARADMGMTSAITVQETGPQE